MQSLLSARAARADGWRSKGAHFFRSENRRARNRGLEVIRFESNCADADGEIAISTTSALILKYLLFPVCRSAGEKRAPTAMST